MSAIRDVVYPDGEWRRGNGRPSKKALVEEYIRVHPDAKNKSEIAKELGLSRPTVTKYYDEIMRQLAEERRQAAARRDKMGVDQDGNITVKTTISQALSDALLEELIK